MGKIKGFIIFILITAAFIAGIYFKDDAIKLYQDLNKQLKNFQQSDVGKMIAQAEKKIFSPPPLNVGGIFKPVVLLQSEVIKETNLQRQENGDLPALEESIILNRVASAKAVDLFKNQYFEHVSPSGVGPGDLAQSYGYDYILEGENLILGNFSSEKEVVQNWMDSPGHRANILNDRYTEIGVAIVKGTYNGQTVWIGVQEFGLPSSVCEQPSQSFKDQIDYNQSQLDMLAGEINAKRREIEKIDQRSAVYSQMVDDYNQLVQSYNSLVRAVKNFITQYNQQVNSYNNCVAGK
jgi:uncharacterized protein YkwD